MRGLEVRVLSDPSMQGKEQVMSMMHSCDPDSPWPHDPAMQFSTMWWKWVKLEAMSVTFNLRDFPQNLLDIRTLALWGKLAGAEPAVTQCSLAYRTGTSSDPPPLVGQNQALAPW